MSSACMEKRVDLGSGSGRLDAKAGKIENVILSARHRVVMPQALE